MKKHSRKLLSWMRDVICRRPGYAFSGWHKLHENCLSLRALMAHVSEQKSWRTTRLLKSSQFALQKERRVFQPLLFRGHSLVFGSVFETHPDVFDIFLKLYIGLGMQLLRILSGHFLEWSIADRPCFPSEKTTLYIIYYIHDYMCMYIDTICKYTEYTCVFIAVFFHFVIEEVHLR